MVGNILSPSHLRLMRNARVDKGVIIAIAVIYNYHHLHGLQSMKILSQNTEIRFYIDYMISYNYTCIEFCCVFNVEL